VFSHVFLIKSQMYKADKERSFVMKMALPPVESSKISEEYFGVGRGGGILCYLFHAFW